jgi:dTDP-4-amino-4,6-dideoxygalactose transaminase
MAVPLLDLKAQHARVHSQVVDALMRVVDEQKFILGEPVTRLESLIAELSRCKHAVGCASGTDALLLALRALDVGPGAEVVTTPFTFFATAGTVHNVGARPVFADIDPDTFNINPAAAAAAVSSRTKALIPVDLFGQMAPLEEIESNCRGVPIIEDAAQAIGAQSVFAGRSSMAGERATIATLSFFPSKNLGGYGDGGMTLTQDEALALRMRRLRVHGGFTQYIHDEVGYNSRLDALQAAVLAAKLPHLGEWSAARRRNAAYYSQALAGVGDIVTPVVRAGNTSIFNQYTIRTQQRDALREHLNARGIGTAIYYPLPLHLQPCFSYLGYGKGAFPESERAAAEVLSLPVYPELREEQLGEVADAVRSFFSAGAAR